MVLSLSKNYTDSVTAATIIAAALRKTGMFDPEETVHTTEETNAMVALNLMVKSWAVYGLDTWLRQTVCLWISNPGLQSYYTLGPTGSPAATAWAETVLTADAATSATSITVESINSTHTVNTAKIGVKLDDGTIYWTTINGSPASTITLTVGLTSAASAGNKVYTYLTTNQPTRPSGIIQATRVLNDPTATSGTVYSFNDFESDMRVIGLHEYRSLSQKRQEGPPTLLYYEPTLTNGTLHIWPSGVVNSNYDKIYLATNIYVDDFDATNNNAQFPPEWHLALVYGLAYDLAYEYGLPRSERLDLKRERDEQLSNLLDFDVEQADVRFERDVM